MYLDYSCKSPKCFCSISKGPIAAEKPVLGYLAALPVPGAFCIIRNPLWGKAKTQLSFIICNWLLTFLAPVAAAVFQLRRAARVPLHHFVPYFQAAAPHTARAGTGSPSTHCEPTPTLLPPQILGPYIPRKTTQHGRSSFW